MYKNIIVYTVEPFLTTGNTIQSNSFTDPLLVYIFKFSRISEANENPKKYVLCTDSGHRVMNK